MILSKILSSSVTFTKEESDAVASEERVKLLHPGFTATAQDFSLFFVWLMNVQLTVNCEADAIDTMTNLLTASV